MTKDTTDITVGRIVGIYGVRGQVKVYSDCRPREALFDYHEFNATLPGREGKTLKLIRGSKSGKGLIASFEGINNRDQAAALNGYILKIHRDQLLPAAKDEFYWVDLIGLVVKNREALILGRVKTLFETGANDVLVVEGEEGEILIPFVKPTYIEKIDLIAGEILVDWQTDWLKPSAEDQE